MNRSKFIVIALFTLSLYATTVFADSVVVNNNNNNSGGNPCQNPDQSAQSGPPAGVYNVKTQQGSNEVYTTGTNTPAFNDPCNNSSNSTAQPQVIVPYVGGGRR